MAAMNQPNALRGSARPRALLERLVRRVAALLFWASALLLGAFGTYFSFANYPLLGSALVVSILLASGYSERRRRKQRALERARRRDRARSTARPGP
jgi:hypothetical protein